MDALELREIMKKQKKCREAANGMPPHMKTSKSGYFYCSLVSYDTALDMEGLWQNGGCECMDPETRITIEDTNNPGLRNRYHPACFYVTERPLNSNPKDETGDK